MSIPGEPKEGWTLIAEEAFSGSVLEGKEWRSSGVTLPGGLHEQYDFLRLELEGTVTSTWTNGTAATSNNSSNVLAVLINGKAHLTITAEASNGSRFGSKTLFSRRFFAVGIHSGYSDPEFVDILSTNGTGYQVKGLFQAHLSSNTHGTGTGSGRIRLWGIKAVT